MEEDTLSKAAEVERRGSSMVELQELIVRGRMIFDGAPRRGSKFSNQSVAHQQRTELRSLAEACLPLTKILRS